MERHDSQVTDGRGVGGIYIRGVVVVKSNGFVRFYECSSRMRLSAGKWLWGS